MALTVTAEGLINAYVGGLDDISDELWWIDACAVSPTRNAEIIKAVALGQSKGLTPWPAGTEPTSQQLAKYNVSMSVEDYHDGFPIPLDGLEGNPEIWNDKASQTAGETQDSVQSLVSAHVVANKPGLDGVALFSASHVIGTQAAQTNLLTATEVTAANITDPANPTIDEAINIITGTHNYMKTYKGENGRLVNRRMNSLVIVVNTGAHFDAFSAAATVKTLAGNATNRLFVMVESGQLEVKVRLDPSLTGSNKVRFFSGRPGKRAIVAALEGPTDMSILDSKSEYARDHNGVKFAVKVSFGVASGWWANAAELTLS